jgi:hypothetical protein
LLGTEALLEILKHADIQSVAQNAFSVFRMLDNALHEDALKEQALELLEQFWLGEGLTPSERQRLRNTGLQTFFTHNNIVYCSFASDWLIATLSLQEEDEMSDVFLFFLWSDHDPKTVAGSLINLMEQGDQLGGLLEQIREVVELHETQKDSKDWQRYTAARMIEAAILFVQDQADEGFRILGELEAQKECETQLQSALLFLGSVIEQCDSPRSVEYATAYYERAFRQNPHRAYEPFYTCKLYSLYLRSENPEIRTRGIELALQRMRESFETLNRVAAGVRRTGDPTPETLVIFIDRLGRGLLLADRQEDVLTLYDDYADNQDFLTKLRELRNGEAMAETVELFKRDAVQKKQ